MRQKGTTVIDQERTAPTRQGADGVRGAAEGAARCRADRRPRLDRLHYVCEQTQGITRGPGPDGFIYRHPSGRVVRNPATLERIRRLAIPPAWTDVWVCVDPDGHLQATGRDTKGRKQYRYHPTWREMREAGKFERLAAFGRALPEIRRQAEADLACPDLSKNKVVGLVVVLLDLTLLRVGNEEYARQNKAYGLTTLRDRHAFVCGSDIKLVFKGKGGKTQLASIRNRRLARVVKRSQELPGEVLFQYLDDAGRPEPVTSGDVNDYLRSVAGSEFSAKDFRTWGGSLIAARELARRAGSRDGGRRDAVLINEAADVAAAYLGNTRAVARRSYIHPGIVAAFLDGRLAGIWADALSTPVEPGSGRSAEEEALLAVLDRMAPLSA